MFWAALRNATHKRLVAAIADNHILALPLANAMFRNPFGSKLVVGAII